MRPIYILTAILLAGACKEPSAPPPALEARHLTAVLTGDNHCDVDFDGKHYSSIGQIRGALMPQFTDTINLGYHGVGCWVAATGADGDFRVIFSGNHFMKPLDGGTYRLAGDIFDNSPIMTSTITFFTSEIPGDRWKVDESRAGSVTVEETALGRKISVDGWVFRYHDGL